MAGVGMGGSGQGVVGVGVRIEVDRVGCSRYLRIAFRTSLSSVTLFNFSCLYHI